MSPKMAFGTFACRASLAAAALLSSTHSGVALAADASSDASASAIEPPHPTRFGRIGQKLAEWQVVVGAGAMLAPKYEGSDEFEVIPLPFVSATFYDVLTIDPRGATMTVFERGPFALDARLGYEKGRNEDDSDHLKGLGDIDFGGTVGAKASAQLGPASFFAQVDKTIGGSEGLLGRLGLEVTQPLSEVFVVGAGASAVVADEKHMQAYFGVSPEQTQRSGLAPYDVGAGLKRADFSVSATYIINDNWIVRGEAELGVLLGDAADSPIVQDKLQPSAMLVVGYKF